MKKCTLECRERGRENRIVLLYIYPIILLYKRYNLSNLFIRHSCVCFACLLLLGSTQAGKLELVQQANWRLHQLRHFSSSPPLASPIALTLLCIAMSRRSNRPSTGICSTATDSPISSRASMSPVSSPRSPHTPVSAKPSPASNSKNKRNAKSPSAADTNTSSSTSSSSTDSSSFSSSDLSKWKADYAQIQEKAFSTQDSSPFDPSTPLYQLLQDPKYKDQIYPPNQTFRRFIRKCEYI